MANITITSSLYAGCYGDGTHGHQHTRARCADTIESLAGGSDYAEIIAALRGEMSDDASEEDDACEVLEQIACMAGHSWGWQDGDFGLWTDESVECSYCGADVPGLAVPEMHDDAAWGTLAAQHNPKCEWVETRAHRRDGVCQHPADRAEGSLLLECPDCGARCSETSIGDDRLCYDERCPLHAVAS